MINRSNACNHLPLKNHFTLYYLLWNLIATYSIVIKHQMYEFIKN